MKTTVEFEEKDILNKTLLVDQWGTRHMIVRYVTSYQYNLLNLGTANLIYETPAAPAELANYLNMYKFLPENQTSL